MWHIYKTGLSAAYSWQTNNSPYLQLDFFPIQLNSSDFEINSWQQRKRETSSDLQWVAPLESMVQSTLHCSGEDIMSCLQFLGLNSSSKKLFIPRTWKSAIMAFTFCLQCCVLFSDSMICNKVVTGDLVRFSWSFNRVNCAFTFHLRYHITHDTQQKQLQFTVIDVHKCCEYIAVSCFRVPDPGPNATRKPAQGGNWFSRNHHAI